MAKRQAALAAGHGPPGHDAQQQQQQLASWLLALLAAHARESLREALALAAAPPAPRGWAPPAALDALSRCAALCVCCCLALQQQQPLFQQVFALFQQAERALFGAQQLQQPPPPPAGSGLVRCSPLAAFLEALEPHILADRLPSLAPEAVQALVEHFATGAGGAVPPQPQRVERCVLHLDVFTLDLDQVSP